MAAGNTWRALRRNDDLAPVGELIQSFVKEAEDRERKKKIFDLLSNAKNQINQGFEPTEMLDPNFQSLQRSIGEDPGFNEQSTKDVLFRNIKKAPTTKNIGVNYEAGTKNAKNVLSDMLLKSIGDEDLNPQDLSQGIEALKLSIPDKPKKPEGYTLGDKQQRYEYNPKTQRMELVAENKGDIKPPENFKNFSAKGYWDTRDPQNPKWVENKNYKPDTQDININIPDNSVQEGKTISAIKLMQDIKNTKPNEDGSYTVPSATGSGLKNFKTYDDLTKYKEQVKASYIEPVIQTIKQQGLVPAKDNVKKDVEELKSKLGLKPEDTPTPEMLELTLRKMKKDNPQLDDEQIDIIRSYFTFFYQ